MFVWLALTDINPFESRVHSCFTHVHLCSTRVHSCFCRAHSCSICVQSCSPVFYEYWEIFKDRFFVEHLRWLLLFSIDQILQEN